MIQLQFLFLISYFLFLIKKSDVQMTYKIEIRRNLVKDFSEQKGLNEC